MTPDRAKAVRELLAFYLEAGVDAVVGDEPKNRLAQGEAVPQPGTSPVGGGRERSKIVPERAQSATERSVPSSGSPARGHTASGGGNKGSDILAASVAPPSPEVAIMAAREAAKSAASLDELRAILQGFEG